MGQQECWQGGTVTAAERIKAIDEFANSKWWPKHRVGEWERRICAAKTVDATGERLWPNGNLACWCGGVTK